MSVGVDVAPTGTIAHLRLSFELMADMTGSAATPAKMNQYAKYMTDHHIALNDVRLAVADMLNTWQKPFWPSPESIGAKAREIAAHRAFRESPGGLQSVEIEQHTLRERQRAWEERCYEAEQWCSTREEEALEVAKEVEHDIQARIERSPKGFLATNKAYREAWREGAMVGTIMRRIGEQELKLVRLRIIAERMSGTHVAQTGG